MSKILVITSITHIIYISSGQFGEGEGKSHMQGMSGLFVSKGEQTMASMGGNAKPRQPTMPTQKINNKDFM